MTASIRQGAFTLVELLVVVTIIVLLLALLTPALSRAVYEAQLVQCGAQMRLAASGQVLYAMDHKRYWMYRRVIENRHTFSHLLKGAKVFIAVDADIDDRPVHEGYVDLDWLFDTLATKVDPKLHPGEMENPQETIYSNYSLQYGWGYTLGDSGIEYPPMKKMGDRWEARDDKRGGRVTAFRWLLSDSDMYGRDPASGEGGGADASHPDRGQTVLWNNFAQAGSWDYGAGEGANVGLGAGLPVTFSFWQNRGAWRHGRMDLNFAADDNSVHRLNDVKNEMDERIAHVPHQRLSGSGNVWLNIAKP